MKITYLQQIPSRAGQRIPVQDVEDGEKFRVVAQRGIFLANILADDDRDIHRDRYKRRGNSLYKLKPALRPNSTKQYSWQRVNAKFWIDNPLGVGNKYAPWMTMLRVGRASVTVEIY